MLSVLFWCFCFVFVYGDLRQVTLPEYTPPSQEEILNTYFRDSDETNRTKKSILSVSEKFQKTVEAMKKELSANISHLQKELVTQNVTGVDGSNVSGTQDYVRAGFFKNYLTAPVEPTTYRYPTAVWSSQTYEKLKSTQKFRPRNATSRVHASRPTLNPAYVYLDRGLSFSTPEKALRKNRGKTKWKDTNRNFENLGNQVTKIDRSEFADRFLEQSLTKYLISSNLRDNVGNVSVKTFSDILKNITEGKPRRLQSPYDENKELRMKFREEVILKKKNETRPHGRFLEKQLQRRLEKVQDVFNERDKDKILANMWRYTTLNRTTEASEERKNLTTNAPEETSTINVTSAFEILTETTTTQLYNSSLIYITTEHPLGDFSYSTEPPRVDFSYSTETPLEDFTYSAETPRVDFRYSTQTPRVEFKYSTENNRGTARYHRKRLETTQRSRELEYEPSEKSNKNLLKLTAEESSYYRKGQFPSLTFIGQPEKPGVIPGRPLVDYPVHSFPPVTKFKCPKFKEGKPRMMADPETRCQVFYICTGDGPTTAMLCPNGTMFNENFLVCDWWYNVNC